MEFYEIIVIVFLITFIASLFLGYPIAWTLGGLSLLFTAGGIVLHDYFGVDTFLLTRWENFAIIIDRTWALMTNWLLVALPMFVYMGLMLDRSGVAELMLTNFVRVFGQLRGGLAITTILMGILLAASTGIVGASVVLLATLTLPIMMQQNYSKSFASGVVASAGTLGVSPREVHSLTIARAKTCGEYRSALAASRMTSSREYPCATATSARLG